MVQSYENSPDQSESSSSYSEICAQGLLATRSTRLDVIVFLVWLVDRRDYVNARRTLCNLFGRLTSHDSSRREGKHDSRGVRTRYLMVSDIKRP